MNSRLTQLTATGLKQTIRRGCVDCRPSRLIRPMTQSTACYQEEDKLHPIFANTSNPPLPSFSTDPYPIPLQNPNHHTTKNNSNQNEPSHNPLPAELFQESYDDHHPSTIDILRSRLIYQSRKRGIVEIELLLSTFVQSQHWLKHWHLEQLTQYSRLLMVPDWDLYYYLIKKHDPPPHSEFLNSPLLAQLQEHASNSNKTPRTMPSLHKELA